MTLAELEEDCIEAIKINKELGILLEPALSFIIPRKATSNRMRALPPMYGVMGVMGEVVSWGTGKEDPSVVFVPVTKIILYLRKIKERIGEERFYGQTQT